MVGWKPIKAVAELRNDVLSESTASDYTFEYIDIGNVTSDGRVAETETMTFAHAPSRARRPVRRGDVIVSTVRTYLKAIAPIEDERSDLVASTGFAVLRPRPELVDPRFLSYTVRSAPVVASIVAHSEGVSYPAIAPSKLARLAIPVPSRTKQRAIVRFLDEETARIDTLIERKLRLQLLLKKELNSFLDLMLWPNPMPSDWSMTPLMRLTQPDRPIMYGIVLPGPNVANGVPLVKGGDVSNDRLSLDLLNKTSREIEAPYARARLRGGDIVLTIRGRYGDAALVPDGLTGANITQDIARIAPQETVNRRWLLRVLQSQPIVRKINNEALGAAVQGVNIRDVKRYQIPVPPLNEQERLASIIDEKLSSIEMVGESLTEARKRLAEYRSALITAAVTGQIDVGRAA